MVGETILNPIEKGGMRMAFELFKAKLEAKRAKKEAILAIDKYISALSMSLPEIKDVELRRQTEDEISKLVAVKEVYKKNTELPKWASELISTSLKVATLAGSVVACEVITNRGTGDKIVTDAIKRLPGI
jgi:hypothetical protein